ncbi:hypothetical protein [Achromobacter aegrifaciens]
MKKLSPLEVVILISLNKNKGIFGIFSLFRKVNVPMADFMKSLVGLQRDGLIRLSDDQAFLLKEGFRRLSFNRDRGEVVSSSVIPDYMARVDSIAVDTFYIPAISRLDGNLFRM